MSQAPSQGYRDFAPEDNTSSAKTASSYSGSNVTNSSSGPTLNEQIGGNLPQNFSISNTKAETRGEENVIPAQTRPGEPLDHAARPESDHQRVNLQSHDIDLPEQDPSRPPQLVGGKKGVQKQSIY